MEENFRNALAISNGHLVIFVSRPISAVFLGLCALLIVAQFYARVAQRRVRNRAVWPVAGVPQVED
jgi:TctA family transporter